MNNHQKNSAPTDGNNVFVTKGKKKNKIPDQKIIQKSNDESQQTNGIIRPSSLNNSNKFKHRSSKNRSSNINDIELIVRKKLITTTTTTTVSPVDNQNLIESNVKTVDQSDSNNLIAKNTINDLIYNNTDENIVTMQRVVNHQPANPSCTAEAVSALVNDTTHHNIINNDNIIISSSSSNLHQFIDNSNINKINDDTTNTINRSNDQLRKNNSINSLVSNKLNNNNKFTSTVKKEQLEYEFRLRPKSSSKRSQKNRKSPSKSNKSETSNMEINENFKLCNLFTIRSNHDNNRCKIKCCYSAESQEADECFNSEINSIYRNNKKNALSTKKKSPNNSLASTNHQQNQAINNTSTQTTSFKLFFSNLINCFLSSCYCNRCCMNDGCCSRRISHNLKESKLNYYDNNPNEPCVDDEEKEQNNNRNNKYRNNISNQGLFRHFTSCFLWSSSNRNNPKQNEPSNCNDEWSVNENAQIKKEIVDNYDVSSTKISKKFLFFKNKNKNLSIHDSNSFSRKDDELIDGDFAFPPPVTCIRVLRPSNDLTPVRFDSHYNIIQALSTGSLSNSSELSQTNDDTITKQPSQINQPNDEEIVQNTASSYYVDYTSNNSQA